MSVNFFEDSSAFLFAIVESTLKLFGPTSPSSSLRIASLASSSPIFSLMSFSRASVPFQFQPLVCCP